MNKLIRIIIKIILSILVFAFILAQDNISIMSGGDGIPLKHTIIGVLLIAIWSYKPKQND